MQVEKTQNIKPLRWKCLLHALEIRAVRRGVSRSNWGNVAGGTGVCVGIDDGAPKVLSPSKTLTFTLRDGSLGEGLE